MVPKLMSGHDFIVKISKENNSVQNVGEATVLVFCKSSADALCLY